MCVVPDVVHQCEQVLVTEWIDGIPLAEVIADGTQEQRDRAGQLLARFLFSGPARTGLLHADPHPGNFRLLPGGSARRRVEELAAGRAGLRHRGPAAGRAAADDRRLRCG